MHIALQWRPSRLAASGEAVTSTEPAVGGRGRGAEDLVELEPKGLPTHLLARERGVMFSEWLHLVLVRPGAPFWWPWVPRWGTAGTALCVQ